MVASGCIDGFFGGILAAVEILYGYKARTRYARRRLIGKNAEGSSKRARNPFQKGGRRGWKRVLRLGMRVRIPASHGWSQPKIQAVSSREAGIDRLTDCSNCGLASAKIQACSCFGACAAPPARHSLFVRIAKKTGLEFLPHYCLTPAVVVRHQPTPRIAIVMPVLATDPSKLLRLFLKTALVSR